jgi:hypothetical protein
VRCTYWRSHKIMQKLAPWSMITRPTTSGHRRAALKRKHTAITSTHTILSGRSRVFVCDAIHYTRELRPTRSAPQVDVYIEPSGNTVALVSSQHYFHSLSTSTYYNTTPLHAIQGQLSSIRDCLKMFVTMSIPALASMRFGIGFVARQWLVAA